LRIVDQTVVIISRCCINVPFGHIVSSRAQEQLNNKILAVHDKIKNIFFDQIDKQLELVNISMNSTSQTTNQISSDCYKETIKMSTTRENMPKWNIDATTTNYDYSLINNSQDTCTSQTIREVKTPHIITHGTAGGMSYLRKESWHSPCQCYL
jgi:hypothetical protein